MQSMRAKRFFAKHETMGGVEMGSSTGRWGVLLLLLMVAFCYHNAIWCGFVFDDVSAIKENRDLRPHISIWNLFKNDFWGTPMYKEQSHKSYRPLCILTFRWNYALHELEPMGYHVVNVVLHGIVTVMYLRLCSIFLPSVPSFVAAMLFAVHPIHTEAVTGVVGRAELLSSLFFLASFFSYVRATRRRRTDWFMIVATILFATMAMLCKEQGVTVFAVCIVYELFFVQKLRFLDFPHVLEAIIFGKGGMPSWAREGSRRITVLAAATFILLVIRLRIMGGQLPAFTRFDNPISVAPFPSRQLTYNYLVAVNAWLLLFPSDLCCDWTMGTISVIDGLTDPRNLASLSFYCVLFKLFHIVFFSQSRHHAKLVLMSLALMVFPFLPASNLFFPVGFVVAERILYTPSMGFCLLVAYGWSLLLKKSVQKRLAWIGLIFLMLMHASKTLVRNLDWESEYTIFMAGLRVNHQNAKLFNNVGHALESQGKFEEALDYFQKAVLVQPDDVGAYINMGRTYNNLKMFKEAEVIFNKAKDLLPKPRPGESYHTKVAPNHLNVFINLANLISKNESRLEEADALYRQAISMRSDYTQAYINRGDVLIKLNRTKEAQEVYEKALEFDNNNPDIYYNLGVVFLEQGKTPQALAYLNKALEFDPDHEQALMNSAILIQESGNLHLRKTAYERLLRLIKRGHSNEKIYFNLGMLAMDEKDLQSAEMWLRKAVQVKDDFRSALFNLALLLSDRQRPLEAAPFLHQLLKNHPDHIKGLILLGDIYINNIRDLDAAEQCYQRILSLDPNNIQGLHNLCVVYIERGELERAEKCFVTAANLAPQEEYIQRHLRIVRSVLQKQFLDHLHYTQYQNIVDTGQNLPFS